MRYFRVLDSDSVEFVWVQVCEFLDILIPSLECDLRVGMIWIWLHFTRLYLSFRVHLQFHRDDWIRRRSGHLFFGSLSCNQLARLYYPGLCSPHLSRYFWEGWWLSSVLSAEVGRTGSSMVCLLLDRSVFLEIVLILFFNSTLEFLVGLPGCSSWNPFGCFLGVGWMLVPCRILSWPWSLYKFSLPLSALRRFWEDLSR